MKDMKIQKVQITSKHLDEILKSLDGIHDEPMGNHLSEDDFVEYAMEALSENDVKRIDAHLESCTECAIKMENLLEKSEIWEGEKGQQRVNASKNRCRLFYDFAQATKSLANLDLAAESMRSREVWCKDYGILHGSGVKEANGDWTFRFSSDELSLLNEETYFHYGSIVIKLEFCRIQGGEIFAEVTIPRYRQNSEKTRLWLSIGKEDYSIPSIV